MRHFTRVSVSWIVLNVSTSQYTGHVTQLRVRGHGRLTAGTFRWRSVPITMRVT